MTWRPGMNMEVRCGHNPDHLLAILRLGGGSGYYGYNRYGGSGLGGVLSLVLIVLLVLWLAGGVQFYHP
jgi:hypothetical protein